MHESARRIGVIWGWSHLSADQFAVARTAKLNSTDIVVCNWVISTQLQAAGGDERCVEILRALPSLGPTWQLAASNIRRALKMSNGYSPQWPNQIKMTGEYLQARTVSLYPTRQMVALGNPFQNPSSTGTRLPMLRISLNQQGALTQGPRTGPKKPQMRHREP